MAIATADCLKQSIRATKLAKLHKSTNTIILYPCAICKFEVKHNDKAILCTVCDHWIHIKCNGITVDEYKSIQSRNLENPELVDNESWSCLSCIMQERRDYVPFIQLGPTEIQNLNSTDSMNLFELLPCEEKMIYAQETNNLKTNDDINEDSVEKINSKYYSCEEFYKLDNKQDFKILHTNLNGYVSHADSYHEFLVQASNEPEIICISETSVFNEDKIPPDSQLQNYTEPFLTNTISSKGGVAIFTKNHLDVFERDDLKKEGNKEFEAVWIEIKKKGSKNIVVGCLYRHPHSSNLKDFSSYINTCLVKLNKESKEIYVTGDFNIDLLKYDSNCNYRDFYNLITSNGFLPLILQPTRITDSSQTLIDNIFTNAFTHESISGNILIEFADHLTQFASVQKLGYDANATVSYKRCNKNWKEENFLHDLSTQTWSNDTNPVAKLDALMANLTSCVDKHLPRKKLTKREIKMKTKPWINTTILRKIKHRNDLFSRKKADPDNNFLKSAYNRFRNSVNRDIKTSKQKYYNSYFVNCQNNVKKTWKGINELISSRAKTPIKVSQIKTNDAYIDDPTMIANSFNNFFVNVGPNLDKEIPKTPISPLSYLKSRVDEDLIFSSLASLAMVKL